jgi:hypothetical protein
MMLLHQYQQLLKIESPLALQFLIFTVINDSQKFDQVLVNRVLQKLFSVIKRNH